MCPISWWQGRRMIVCQFALPSISEPKTIQTTCPQNSLVTTAGFIGTTWKQSKCPPSGTWHHLLDQRKRGRWSPMSRPCCLHSLTLTGWSATPPWHCAQTSPWEVALWQLDPAPWQGPCPQGCHHEWIYGEKQHSVTLTPSLLSWPCSVWCNFFLFPQLMETMKGRRFDYVEEIQPNAVRQLRAITKSDYQRCFCQWQEHWNKGIQAQGHYFKGDKTN